MDHDRFQLSTSREPNPLRPYHVPLSATNTSAATLPHSTVASSSLGSAARDAFPDIDLKIDLDIRNTTSEAWQQTRHLFDTLAWRYTSVLLAQPFDVAKTLLQISLPPEAVVDDPARPSMSRQASRHSARYQDLGRSRREYDYTGAHGDAGDSDTSDDMPDYFTSAVPRSRSPRRRRRTPPSASLSPSPTPKPRNRKEHDPGQEYKLRLKRLDSIRHVLSAVYVTSGTVGWWRATNCTFLYSILLRTTDSFVRSLLLALIGLPDIISPEPAGLGPNLSVTGAAGFSGLDLSESPNLFGSLVIVGLSSCITGLLLAPLDLVRTRLIITPTSTSPRGLVQSLRRLPSLVAPSLLWLPTALHHSLPQIFSAAAPVFLRRQLGLSPELTPSTWSAAAFATSLADLFLRLPLETVVRRAQVAALTRADPHLPTIVDPAPYPGVWATVYAVMYAEGERHSTDAKGMLRIRRGHGPAGLVRGWRIGFWGLVGVWGAGAMGPGEGRARGQF